MAMRTRLHQVADHGQSVWIDFLSRELLESGALGLAVERDAVVGVTSNPTIFAKALADGDRPAFELTGGPTAKLHPASGRLHRAARSPRRRLGARGQFERPPPGGASRFRTGEPHAPLQPLSDSLSAAGAGRARAFRRRPGS